jgi:uncharacterized protein
MQELEKKYEKLREIIGGFPRLLVAYSGGADSAFLLKVARDVLGDKVSAAIADSPSLPRRELKQALMIARDYIGIEPKVIETREMENPEYLQNNGNRCYFCKSEMFVRMERYASETGIPVLAFGENADDRNDHRPGAQAAREHDVRAPLREAELAKEEIRQLSRQLGLPTWEKPAAPCLSSRFPYGEKITPEGLLKVEQAEDFLHQLGFRNLRVRHHDNLARIEVPEEEISQITDPALREKITARFKEIGYLFVCVDLTGLKSGSLNVILKQNQQFVAPPVST